AATVDTRGRNLFQAGGSLLFNGVLDHTYSHRPLQTRIISGQQRDQITAIGEDLLLAGRTLERQTTQKMGSPLKECLQKADSNKAAIYEDEHPWFNGAQQSLSQAWLRGGARSNHHINDGVGSHFSQVDRMQLREGALGLACIAPTKVFGVGKGVSHI